MILHLSIIGQVQGVGYRDWAVQVARETGLSGWVRNRMDGTVEAVVAGETAMVEDFIGRARQGPSAARVDWIERTADEAGDALPYPFERRPTA